MRPTVLKVNGERNIVQPKNGTDYTLKELQDIVGGYIEIVYLSSTQIMVVNEEGALNGMQHNANATMVASMTRGCVTPIFGNVLICDSAMVK